MTTPLSAFGSSQSYYRARYYDSGSGSFISDPLPFNGANFYTYVSNSPVDWIDPTGLFAGLICERISLMRGGWRNARRCSRTLVFKDKGRIRVGADADITVFDPNTVIDKATYEKPLQYSQGIPFVLVGGVPVVRDGKLVDGVFPGRAARALTSQ